MLRTGGMETGESTEPPSSLLAKHRLTLRSVILGLPEPAERLKPNINQRVGDLLLADQVTVCEADPQSCHRTTVSYADGTRSMHHAGLEPAAANLLEEIGVSIQAIPCNHHGGIAITAVDRV